MDPSCPSCHFPKIPAQVSLSWFSHFARILNLKDASGPSDSGDGVVEDELLSELTDNPGTTRGAQVSVLQIMRFPFRVNRGS